MNTNDQPQERSGGQLLMAALSAHGVDTVFGIPGTHNLGIFAAMDDHGIRNVTTRHEQGAGYAADGYARSSGRVGVVVTTTGPGATNAATALGQAYSDSVPVLLIAPGVPTDHPSDGDGLLHEQVDQRATLAGVVRQSHRVQSLAEIPTAVARAFARMGHGRARPEYLEIPLDLIDAQGNVADVAPLAPAAPVVPAEAQIKSAAEALSGAEKLLIIAGGGAANAGDQVAAVAEYFDAPVITSTNGKGTLPEDHPLALGAGMQIDAFPGLVESVDAVLAIGTELASADWFGRYPDFPATFVRIDVDPTGLLTNVAPSHALLGDSAETLRLLLEALPAREGASEPRSQTELKERFSQAQEASAEAWMESFRSLNEVLPAETVIAADNAMSAYNGAVPAIRLHRSRSFLFPTGFGTLGYGLPAGIGAKVASPETPVVVLQGDGGMMFVIGELAAAAEAGLGLPVIIYDNGGYGEIRNEMDDRGDRVHSVALRSPDFPAMAEAMGCHGVHLSDPTELGRTVLQALEADRPTVIHVIEHSRAAAGMRS
ncbi:5-guanidino-2-oxopentanoate decarboxylase [Zhihengliuella alba]|uniref:5-guanidino-2-oxopentanoate decarboxylase n=1 Tax=Zhihengliuella alba TaxID=547018 RepID=A0ABP7DQH2_9MICC